MSLKSPCMMQAITRRHGVAAEQLRVFLHYQPSYYHLHVHFLHVKHDAGMGMAVGKAHLLSDVISESLLSLCSASIDPDSTESLRWHALMTSAPSGPSAPCHIPHAIAESATDANVWYCPAGNIHYRSNHYAVCTLHTAIGEKDPLCPLLRRTS